ncbi:hypothetical protein ACFXJ8_26215 [Nonomuraea sp. NPDC059194]|uniref:hypothetical protein n=1 Tax=Nonomuraea sp. NPDC059194 TaxID=3346764 RepID=UPI0036A0D217
MTIQAIDTRYKGCRFRSRLEARWAVFLDTLGIRWEYEPQGYLVGAKRRPYLPDFYLTDLNWWVEVKGPLERLDVPLLLDAVDPIHGLGRSDAFHMTNMLVLGDLPAGEVPHGHLSIRRSRVIGTPARGQSSHVGVGCGGDCTFTGPLFGFHFFAPACGILPDVDDDGFRRMLCKHGALLVPASRASTALPKGDVTEPIPLARAPYAEYLEHAYVAARSARFEHGESG